MSGGSGEANRAARTARAEERARNEQIAFGTQQIRNLFAKQFDDSYFDKLRDVGTERYTPEVNDQYEMSLRDLRAALLRSGISNSTAAVDMQRGLDEQRGKALQDIKSNVQGVVNQRRQQIANAELQTIGQLQASGDASAAAEQARSMINLNTKPEAWSPLGQVFTDVTAGLATQAELERAGRNRYNVGVSNWFGSKPSGRYTTNVGA